MLGTPSPGEMGNTMIKLYNLKEERQDENSTFLWMLECEMCPFSCLSDLWLDFWVVLTSFQIKLNSPNLGLEIALFARSDTY